MKIICSSWKKVYTFLRNLPHGCIKCVDIAHAKTIQLHAVKIKKKKLHAFGRMIG